MSHQKLPQDRQACVHKFSVGGVSGYLRVGLFPDGKPGEVFINMNKSADAGLMSCLGILISMSLQRGVSLEDIVRKLSYTQFEPRGPTKNPEIPMATSVVDYVVRWLWLKYGQKRKGSRKFPSPRGPG